MLAERSEKELGKFFAASGEVQNHFAPEAYDGSMQKFFTNLIVRVAEGRSKLRCQMCGHAFYMYEETLRRLSKRGLGVPRHCSKACSQLAIATRRLERERATTHERLRAAIERRNAKMVEHLSRRDAMIRVALDEVREHIEAIKYRHSVIAQRTAAIARQIAKRVADDGKELPEDIVESAAERLSLERPMLRKIAKELEPDMPDELAKEVEKITAAATAKINAAAEEIAAAVASAAPPPPANEPETPLPPTPDQPPPVPIGPLPTPEEALALLRVKDFNEQQVAAIRGQIQALITQHIGVAHSVLSGGTQWNGVQARLFLALLNKVLPDLSANFSTNVSLRKNLDELSRSQLEAIAAGQASIVIDAKADDVPSEIPHRTDS